MSQQQLSDYGITRMADGRIRLNGGEVHVPTNLLWFSLDFEEESLHLPGSEDGDPTYFRTELEFIQFCNDMADPGDPGDDGNKWTVYQSDDAVPADFDWDTFEN